MTRPLDIAETARTIKFGYEDAVVRSAHDRADSLLVRSAGARWALVALCVYFGHFTSEHTDIWNSLFFWWISDGTMFLLAVPMALDSMWEAIKRARFQERTDVAVFLWEDLRFAGRSLYFATFAGIIWQRAAAEVAHAGLR